MGYGHIYLLDPLKSANNVVSLTFQFKVLPLHQLNHPLMYFNVMFGLRLSHCLRVPSLWLASPSTPDFCVGAPSFWVGHTTCYGWSARGDCLVRRRRDASWCVGGGRDICKSWHDRNCLVERGHCTREGATGEGGGSYEKVKRTPATAHS